MLICWIWLFHDLPGCLPRQEDSAVDVQGLTGRARHDLVQQSISGWLRTRVGDLRTLMDCLIMLGCRFGGKRRSAFHSVRRRNRRSVRDIL